MTVIENYRRLASETRRTATTVLALDIKDALEQVARDYDRLAGDLDQNRPFAWWSK